MEEAVLLAKEDGAYTFKKWGGGLYTQKWLSTLSLYEELVS